MTTTKLKKLIRIANLFLESFWVAEYKSDAGVSKFKMADRIWRMKYEK